MAKNTEFFQNYFKNCSTIKTTKQHTQATGKRPEPRKEIIMPTASAIIPAKGNCVASIIAGKVITASVTYGT
jgi:hypothetical protein